MSWWRRLFLGLPTENGRQLARPPVLDLDRIEAAARAGNPAARAELIGRLDRLQGEVAGLRTADGHAALVERLDQLLAEVAKLGREQFRATTLLEGHETLLEELAESAREGQDRREDAALEDRRARAEVEARVRLEVMKDLLPVADALDASIRTARELLVTLGQDPPTSPPSRSRWLAWLRGPATPPPTAEEDEAAVGDRVAAFDAWLHGLLLIEGRLQALLEREGIRPIRAVGEPFDPHRHLAVATSRDEGVSDGIVVAEELRGYMAGDRVLRHAEVVVARTAGESSRSDPGAD